MPELTCELSYFNGQLVPARDVALPLYDAGFVLGATVSERLRTFNGVIFQFEEHLQRLARSLEIVALKDSVSLEEIREAGRAVVAHNASLLPPGGDLGVSVFVTPGPLATLAPVKAPRNPTVCVHTYSLPFHLWADKYENGAKLVVADRLQVPAECWPTELKCRSRMHYYLADRAAALRADGADALLLDRQGCITETSAANVLIVDRRGAIVSPRAETILPGISLAFARQLACELGYQWRERDLTSADLASATEILLTSTPYCVLPVTHFQGQAVGSEIPGPVFRQLIQAWSAKVGVDIIRQAVSVRPPHSRW